MKIKDKNLLSLDRFIENSLYDKKIGYYMKNDPFGKKGDFITSPNISILFSEMIAIWIISFWENLKKPKRFNLIELGAGNGEMMKILVNTFNKFPEFKDACVINILEKSNYLKKIQKKNIKNKDVRWLNNLDELNNFPSIFIANEFFDALPIKQFIKKQSDWYERYVQLNDNNELFYKDILFDMEKFEKKIDIKISYKQKFIEYSPLAMHFLKNISKKIISNNGGILIIDYGYTNDEIKNTLQAVSKHKFSDVLDVSKKSDITYNLNFNLMSRMIKSLGKFNTQVTTQKEFLTKLGIMDRAEIVTKNMPFSKKADIYFRINRLMDKRQMGHLFKAMLISNKKNKFKLGF